MGLFTDIYNTVAKFFRTQDEPVEDPSKSVAQNRLKLVLMQDRTNLTPKVLEQMRGEMIDLLSKYLEMDKDLLELNFEQDGNQVALMLSIPVIRAKDEEEIEAALSKEEEDDDVVEDDESEKEDDEEVIDESEDETSDILEDEIPKPKKKRRSKKVSAPEDLSGNDENNNEEMNSENNSEANEQTTVCESTEC